MPSYRLDTHHLPVGNWNEISVWCTSKNRNCNRNSLNKHFTTVVKHMVTSWFLTKLSSKIYMYIHDVVNIWSRLWWHEEFKKNIYLFLIIPLNYKCSKDAKTGLGLVRECLVQILEGGIESQLHGQSSCTYIHHKKYNLYKYKYK